MTYPEFLASKRIAAKPVGFDVERDSLTPMLFGFQSDIVQWALRCGRSAIFADCGLGKSPIQLEWAKHVCEHTGGIVLILAPLAVSKQTKREGEKFGIPVNICRTQADVTHGINITNYEMLSHFDPFQFRGIILDESSILKAFDGKLRKAITEFGHEIHYRLCCTATPAPNDYMELGTHAEFLEVMTHTEMLSMFFVHDGGDTSKWRLKRHAESEFWRWVASWAVAIRKPSDLLYEDGAFILPPLQMHQIAIESEGVPEGYLFQVEANTMAERRDARKESINERVAACADLVNDSAERWLVWCNLNAESEALKSAIPEAVEVTGSDSQEFKEQSLFDFANGKTRVLVSKPLIAGWGMNFQACSNMAFVGLSDSYEQLYQAIRRCWRFGQARPVNCYVITADTEGAVVRNIQRKEQQAMTMMEGMVEHMRDSMQKNLGRVTRTSVEYKRDVKQGTNWTAHLGDCVDICQDIASGSIHYSIFSPPFASLYTYSASDRDMGNAKDYDEFGEHFGFLVDELYRVLMPGRLLSFHCMNLPLTKERDGVIGCRDFRGELIRCFQRRGFIFHSEVCIWKDPVTAMQRTKAIGLLYKQLRKDSTISRQGIPDYLVTMRKPGENPQRVTKTHEGFPVEKWQQYASPVWSNIQADGPNVPPHDFTGWQDEILLRVDKMLTPYPDIMEPVWMGIDPSNTLTRKEAREEEDERHICALQLEVIERGIELWTNPGDLILSPFMGIGSEGYVALEKDRRFIGAELKLSYWEQACKNLEYAEKESQQQQALFV